MDLHTAFNPKWNSLNALRLALATTVIVSHSWPLGGYGEDPRWGDQNLGEWAVAGFFVVSGYLILGSRLYSRSFLEYLWKRFLRIYPAFIVCLLIIAFVIAPLSTVMDGTGAYDAADALSYVQHNVALLITQHGIDGTLSTVPFSGAWDGPMWTLFYEFACYLWIGLLVTVIPRRWLKIVLPLILLACTAACLYGIASGWDLDDRTPRLIRLSGYFVAGATIYIFADKVPVKGTLAVVAGVATIALMPVGLFHVFAGIPLAYVMLFLAVRLPVQSIGSKNDVSYGLYIWAFPVQQLIAIAFPNQELPLFIFVAASVVLTLPLAWASWLLIERPASKLKTVMSKSKRLSSSDKEASIHPLT
jgi:peptidoglycan/LPS O-acetylase OafA/YrhL